MTKGFHVWNSNLLAPGLSVRRRCRYLSKLFPASLLIGVNAAGHSGRSSGGADMVSLVKSPHVVWAGDLPGAGWTVACLGTLLLILAWRSAAGAIAAVVAHGGAC